MAEGAPERAGRETDERLFDNDGGGIHSCVGTFQPRHPIFVATVDTYHYVRKCNDRFYINI